MLETTKSSALLGQTEGLFAQDDGVVPALVRQAPMVSSTTVRHLTEIIEASQIGAWEWNLQTGEFRLNERWAGMLGYTLDELQPATIETCARLRHPGDHAAAMLKVESCLAGDQACIETEVRMRHKAGHWLRILDRARLVSRSPDGRPLLMVGAQQDITGRMASGTELTRATDQLRLCMDIAGLGVWEMDLNADEFRLDHRVREIYGVVSDKERVPGKDVLGCVHPEDRPLLITDARRALETGLPVHSRFRVTTPEGVLSHVDGYAVASAGAEGQPVLLGVNRDITEEVTRTDELEAKRIEAEAANVAKSQFLATMSHEIRTPMNGVIGMLEVLRRTGLTDGQSEHAEVALKSARHLLHLLDDVLNVSKLDAGQVELEERDYSVIDLVHETAALFTANVLRDKVVLETRIDPAVPAWVRGDDTRVRQILTNFVGNAIKFTEAGRVEISADYEPVAQKLTLGVRDTGIGIDEATQARLFQRFVQADTSTTRRYGGTGLGLAICRQLAELMGGEIGVDSAPGRGSLFWLAVPTPAGEDPSIPGAGPEPEPASGLRPLRILVAEDNETNQKVISALLASFGHEFTVVPDGAQAVAAVASGDFDAILMDVQMPVMDGPSAARRIRALGGRSSMVPIIALTANALPGQRADYLAAGMTDYVSKPIDVTALLSALERVG